METKRLWEVTAEARDCVTGKPTGPRRSEIVSSENKVFALCSSALEVVKTYEAFWNRAGSVERVKVISVWPATQEQDDAPRPHPVAGKGARPVNLAPLKAAEKKVKPAAQRRLERRALQRAGHELAMQA